MCKEKAYLKNNCILGTWHIVMLLPLWPKSNAYVLVNKATVGSGNDLSVKCQPITHTNVGVL